MESNDIEQSNERGVCWPDCPSKLENHLTRVVFTTVGCGEHVLAEFILKYVGLRFSTGCVRTFLTLSLTRYGKFLLQTKATLTLISECDRFCENKQQDAYVQSVCDAPIPFWLSISNENITFGYGNIIHENIIIQFTARLVCRVARESRRYMSLFLTNTSGTQYTRHKSIAVLQGKIVV